MRDYLSSYIHLKYLWPFGLFAGLLLVSMSIWGVAELTKAGHFNTGHDIKLGAVISILVEYEIARLSKCFYAGLLFIFASVFTAIVMRKSDYKK